MSWQIIHVRSRTEKRLAEYCEKQEVAYFLPLREETKIYQRRKVTVQLPLFRGYFFASVPPEKKDVLLRAGYVVSFLYPPNERDFLRQLVRVRRSLRIDPTLGAVAALHKGLRVRIKAGPFMGTEGMIEGLKARTAVRINVDMIGQAVLVEIPVEYIEVLG
jgi:transcription antitermination factor NusG